MPTNADPKPDSTRARARTRPPVQARTQAPKPFKIEYIPLDQLQPNPENPRINDPAVPVVADSIKRFGFNSPILASEGLLIIAGHTRWKAAKLLGLDKVPVIRLPHLTTAEALAYSIADNKTGEIAQWNIDLLGPIIERLRLEDETVIPALGFDTGELSELLDKLEQKSPSDNPDDLPDEVPIRAKPGDLWTLGEHRLACGDSTNWETIAALVDGNTCALFHSDPPYFVDYTGSRPAFVDKQGNKRDRGRDWTDAYVEPTLKEMPAILGAMLENSKRVLRPDAPLFMWYADSNIVPLLALWDAADLVRHQTIYWVKPQATFGRTLYPYRHEPCLVGWRKGVTAFNAKSRGGRVYHRSDFSQEFTSVWEISHDGRKARSDPNNIHPTQKPVRLFEIPLIKHTTRGDIVLEPFCGSGSQIIAAERLERRCFAVEISPRFVDAAVARWELFSGRKAEVARDAVAKAESLADERKRKYQAPAKKRAR